MNEETNMRQGILRQVLKEEPREIQQKGLGGLQGRGSLCAGPEKMGWLYLVEMEVDCRVRAPW